jgi:hypothetical protein
MIGCMVRDLSDRKRRHGDGRVARAAGAPALRVVPARRPCAASSHNGAATSANRGRAVHGLAAAASFSARRSSWWGSRRGPRRDLEIPPRAPPRWPIAAAPSPHRKDLDMTERHRFHVPNRIAVIACLASSLAAAAPAASAAQTLEKMPKDLETRFALSALPAALRDRAAVYLLDPAKGYVLDRKGTNGFGCIVERTEWAYEEFTNDIYTAVCYDQEGSKHQLQVWFDVAEMRAKGMPPAAVAKEVTGRFKTGKYKAPARAGVSYMVAPLMRTHPDPDPAKKAIVTMPMPHIMYYAPGLTNEVIGAQPPPSPYPFVFEPGPHGYLIQLLGDTERAKILADEHQLVADLCKYRASLCLGEPKAHGH